MQTVLTIAGFDPSSGAGITADLMVFAAHGLFATACITALTVQSTVGVRSTHPIAATMVEDTLDCLDADLSPAGIKIGMLATVDNIIRICRYLEIVKQKHQCITVLDPVLRSSSGRELVEPDAIKMIRDKLLHRVDWITPNRDELTVLAEWPVLSQDDVPAACRELQTRIAGNSHGHHLGIFATGGHLDPPDDFLLQSNGEELWLRGEHVATRSTHGTGCALSSAFLARLVLGDSPVEAARAAKTYVAGALKTAKGYGSGRGPLNHLWLITNPKDSE